MDLVFLHFDPEVCLGQALAMLLSGSRQPTIQLLRPVMDAAQHNGPEVLLCLCLIHRQESSSAEESACRDHHYTLLLRPC